MKHRKYVVNVTKTFEVSNIIFLPKRDGWKCLLVKIDVFNMTKYIFVGFNLYNLSALTCA